MYKDPAKFKQFIIDYISLIEEIFEEVNNQVHQDNVFNPKQIAELRNAERSFNFLLKIFGISMEWHVRDYFKIAEWNEIKKRRDTVASKISTLIESNEDIENRYTTYCENLKDLRKLTSLL